LQFYEKKFFLVLLQHFDRLTEVNTDP